MFRPTVVAAFAASLMIAPLAIAQDQNAPAGAAPTAPDIKPEKKICKSSPKTGSRVGRQRTCKTADEWDRYERTQREDAERATEMRGDTDMGNT